MLLIQVDDQRAVMPRVHHLLELLGLWGDRKYRYKFYVVFFSFVAVILVPKLVFGYPRLENAIRGIAELIFECNYFFGVLLFSYAHVEYEQFVELLRQIVETALLDHQPPAVSDFVIQLNRYLDKYSRAYCMAIFCAVNIFSMTPLLHTGWMYFSATNDSAPPEFNLHMEEGFYGLDPRTSISHYGIAIIFIIPVAWAGAYMVVLKIVILCNAFKYCSELFKLVKLKIDLLDQTPEESYQRELREILQLHQQTLHSAELLESIFRPILLMQFVFCVLMWCTMTLYFTTSQITAKFVNMFVLFSVVSVETLSYCRLGSDLSQWSEEVARAAFESRWTERDSTVRAYLRLLIMRSHKKVGITAGKFFYADMERFGKMVKTTYSIYIVLKDML